ncbi:MAG: hypothetical protein LBI87_09495 [Candidatus Accumulibacter sp.]|jgi:ABC-type phosphate transport system substrate-binding protein|nr:hypothetical protein [Accumulibacter sp.]
MGRHPFSIRTRAAFFAALLGLSPLARGELAVIVNPRSGVDRLTKSQVINIFLGNHREFPNGLRAKPFDLPASDPDKGVFYRLLVNKDLSQIAAYWSRLVFSGNTSPPTQVDDTRQIIQTVESNRNAIGYIDSQYADPQRVQVVFTLP